MKKTIYIISIIAIIAAIVAILLLNRHSNRQRQSLTHITEQTTTIRTIKVESQTIKVSFTSNGTLEPISELTFVSDVAGRVKKIFVDKGQTVVKGQLLALIDDELLAADYQSAQAAFNALQTDCKRFEQAHSTGGISDQQLDNLKTQLTAAQSRLTVSKRRLEDAHIKSPMNGTINERYFEVGSYLNPGARLYDISDLSQLKLKCNVTERQVAEIEKGNHATITCSVLPDSNFDATITFVGAKGGRALSYPVELTLKTNPQKQLRAGIYAKATFESNEQRKGIMIPRSAVTGSTEGSIVYVINNSKAQIRKVKLGMVEGENVEITEGLNHGEEIAVAGIVNLSDGKAVTIK